MWNYISGLARDAVEDKRKQLLNCTSEILQVTFFPRRYVGCLKE